MNKIRSIAAVVGFVFGLGASLSWAGGPIGDSRFGQFAGAHTAGTDQLVVVYDSQTRASSAQSIAHPERQQRLQQALGQNIRFERYAGDGRVAVMRLDRMVDETRARELARIASDHLGTTVEPDFLAKITSNDPRYSEQWHYYEETGGIAADQAWSKSTGRGAVVAVVDTGYRPHQDLVANILPGYDMVPITLSSDGDGRDSDAQDPGDFVGGGASSWHGTHVSGTVAAVTNNGIGVAGVAYDAKVLPVRVLGRGGTGYSSDIADGIRWAAGLSVVGAPSNPYPADVINLSLGGFRSDRVCDTVFSQAINAARSAGATVVVAAGNDYTDASYSSPANCNGVITVAASNRYAGRAYYSNRGSLVELAAPGGDWAGTVLSTLNSGRTTPGADNYAGYQGTSMAAPHVSAVAALLYSLKSDITPDEVARILTDTARPFPSGSSCIGECGAGIVDARAAVDALDSDNPPPSGSVQYPWGSIDQSALRCYAWSPMGNFTLGYSFTPEKDGRITQLGGRFDGVAQVKLWDANTRTVLATTTVSSSVNGFSYTEIDPVSVKAGTEYRVSSYLIGRAGRYCNYPDSPARSGDVTINFGVYLYGDGYPWVNNGNWFHGLLDVGFEPGSATSAAEYPWSTVNQSDLYCVNGHLSRDYTLGYALVPKTNGTITELGAMSGSHVEIKLWNASTRQLLASVSHTSSLEEFSYQQIAPVTVTAGTEYRVTGYFNADTLRYCSYSPAPVDVGNITIRHGVYLVGDAYPLFSSGDGFYGLMDIGFVPGG